MHFEFTKCLTTESLTSKCDDFSFKTRTSVINNKNNKHDIPARLSRRIHMVKYYPTNLVLAFYSPY